MSAVSASPAGSSTQEYTIRVPKNSNKKFHVMKFTSDRDVDFRKWTNVKMERENNMKEFKGMDEDQPKFKGIRDGGVGENASYYVFTHAADGAIDAYPLQEWYNFQPIQRFKALRNKTMNFFSLMLRKRLRPDAEDDGDEGEEGKKGKKGAAKKDLTISELDEWMNSSDDSGSEKEEGEKDSDEEKKKKKAKKGAAAAKKKKKKGSDDEASEFEETKQLKGVAEEDALRKLLTSDEDSEAEGSGEKSGAEDNESGAEDQADNKKMANKKKKKKAGKDTPAAKKKGKKKDDMNSLIAGSSSELSSDSSDGETKPSKGKKEKDAGKSSRSGTPTVPAKAEGAEPVAVKRKAEGPAAGSSSGVTPPVKKPRSEGSGEGSMMEEAVRRYLARKPMTTTELLQKFKSKKTGMSSEQLVNVMTQILKKINPVKQTIKGKMYLSIKS
ncbi:hypothetical protein B566_EDAN001432 [Ephemera danica]|nr:hypothetical protein B566_EDAN001432 [Ephemera danica]